MRSFLNSFRLNKTRLFIIISIEFLIITFFSYYYYKVEEEKIRNDRYNELKLIADIKENQVKEWLKDRYSQAKIISNAPLMFNEVIEYFNGNKNPVNEKKIQNILRFFVIDYGYYNGMLVNCNGEIILNINSNNRIVDENVKRKIVESCETKNIVTTDVYRSKKTKENYFDIIAPILKAGNNHYAFILRRNLEKAFFPLFQTWNNFTNTSESGIVRVEKDSVVVLNNLRQSPNSALKLKFPLNKNGYVFVEAAKGFYGMFEGLDYREKLVLADVRLIQNTQWALVTKIDQDEIFEEIKGKSYLIIGFGMLIAGSLAFGLVGLYNRRQQYIYQELIGKEKEIRRKHEEFKVVLDSLGEGVITFNTEGIIQYMNDYAERMTGWNFNHVSDKTFNEIFVIRDEVTGKIESNLIEMIVKNGTISNFNTASILVSKFQKEIPITYSGAPILNQDNDIIGIVIAFQDETMKRVYLNKLVESEGRFKEMFQNAGSGMVLATPDFTLIRANNAFCDFLGLTEKEIVGKSFQEFTHPEDIEMGRNQIISLLQGKIDKAIFEKKYINKNGNIVWGLVSAVVLRDVKNHPVNLVTQVVDITSRKETEIALKESENRLVTALKSMNDGVFITDKNGHITELNDSFAHFCRFNSVDECFKSFEEYPDLFEVYLANGIVAPIEMWAVPRALRGEMKTNEEYIIERKDTGERWIGSYSFAPIKSTDGEIIGAIVTARDVTEFKQAEEKLRILAERLELATTAAEIGIWDYNISKNEIIWDDRMYSIYGIKDRSFISVYETWLSTIFPADKDFCNKAVELALSGEKDYNIEFRVIWQDGSVHWLRSSGKVVRDDNNNPIRMVGVNYDITNRKMSDMELETYRNHLEAIVEERTIEIEEINKELKLQIELKNEAEKLLKESLEKEKELSKLKSRFISTASHEFRTPLASVSTSTELIQRYGNKWGPEKINDHLSRIKNSVNHLTKLMNDVIAVNRAEAGKTEFKPDNINFYKLCKNAIEELNIDEIGNVNFTFNYNVKDFIFFLDPDQTQIIVHNLLSNAVKYSLEKGNIEFSVNSDEDYLILLFKDEGIGIPDEDLPRLFEPFHRSANTKSIQGTGLGLSIVKHAVDLHSGKIEVNSCLTEGTVFTVYLPI